MQKKLLNALPLVAIYILWNAPFLLKGFTVQSGVLGEFILLEVGVLAFFTVAALYAGRLGRLYFALSLWSIIFGVTFGIVSEARFSPFFFVAFVIAIRFFLSNREKGDLSVGSASVALFFILLLLSTSLRFVHLNSVTPNSGYLFSIYDNTSHLGVPITYVYGLVFAIGQVSLTLSPITALLFPLIAYLTADNTFLIVRSFRSIGGSSITAAIVTAIACQCENTIGLISGTVSSLALSILPYFIFLAAGMLILTNFYLHRPRKLLVPRINRLSTLLFFILTLAVEFAIVYTGAIYNLAVFGFNSFLSLFSGFLLGQATGVKWRMPVHYVAFAFALQTVLFIPSLIRYALVSPPFFELYSVAGMAAGFIISLSFRNRDNLSRIGIFEFVFSMEAMIASVLLYLTLFSVSFFSGYSEIAVIDFSVFILLVSLPAMWFSNIYLLSVRAFGS